MNEQIIMEKQGVAIVDYFWRLLEQWRGVLLTGLIFAVLMGGVGYTRSVKEYQAAVKAQAEQKKNVVTSTAEETMENPAVKALTFYVDWQEKKDYYENHPVMRIDPTCEERLILRYLVRAENTEETDLPLVIGGYMSMANDEAFVPAVRDCFPPDIPEKYLRDIIQVSLLTDNEQIAGVNGRGMNIVVSLPPRSDFEYDEDAIEKAITDYVTGRQRIMSGKLGDFSISLLSRDHNLTYNQSRVDQQYTAYQRMIGAEQTFNNAYTTLDSSNTRIVNEVIKEGDVRGWLWNFRSEKAQKKVEEATAEPAPIARPRVSKRYPVLGFLVGLILYAGILFMHMIFVREIRDAEEISSMTGLRSFGGVYAFPYSGFPKGFFHDRFVYNFRHREAARPFVEAGRIAQKIAARARHQGVGEISLIVTGKNSDWARQIVASQVKVLEQEQIRAAVIPAEKGLASINEKSLNDMTPAVLVLQSGKTTPATAVSLLVRLGEYDVPVLGTEFLEGE